MKLNHAIAGLDAREHDASVGADIIAARRMHLLSLGFTHELVQTLESSRPTLYKSDVADAKIQGLKDRGFADPQKLITSSPAIFGYAFENIDAKIQGLMDRGFADPQKLITSLPAIFGYAFENIDHRMSMLRRATMLSSTDIVGWMEKEVFLWGTAMDKLWTLAHVVAVHGTRADLGDVKTLRKLVRSNLENVVLAHGEDPSADVASIARAANVLKKKEYSKTEKQRRIAGLPDTDVIRRQYVKRYLSSVDSEGVDGKE